MKQLNNKEKIELEVDLLSDEELDKILEKNNENIEEPVIEEEKPYIKRGRRKRAPNKPKTIVEDNSKLDLSHLHKTEKIKSVKDQIKQEIIRIESKVTIGKYRKGKRKKDPEDLVKSEKKKIDKRQTSIYSKVLNDKFDLIRQTKSGTNEPLQKAEVKKIIINNYLNNEQIEKEICDKRKLFRKVEKIKIDQKKCECEHRFAYFKDNMLYSTCKTCSDLKEWKNINAWYRYIQEQQKGN